MTNLIRLLIVFFLASTIVSARVVSPTPAPKRFNAGDVMQTDADWNPTVVGIYTWVNTNIVATLNKLVSKGSMYVYDGEMLNELPVGSNNQVIVSRSSETRGVKWESYSGEAPLTAKGDLAYYENKAIKRLPVGLDGQVLTLVSGLPAWTSATTNPFPVGSIIAWSPAAAGTSTIPTGWALCNGSNGTPNLIGLMVIGTKPTGDGSSPSPGGFGAYTADTAHGSSTHTHTGGAGGLVTTSDGANSTIIRTNTGGSTGNVATHTHNIGNFARKIAAGSCEPADYALVYIMKL